MRPTPERIGEVVGRVLATPPTIVVPLRVRPSARVCRVCGCTQDDCRRCVERTGRPCRWVAGDLCSACVGPAAVLHDQAERTAHGLAALARRISLRADQGERLTGEQMDELAVKIGLHAAALQRAVESAKGGDS